MVVGSRSWVLAFVACLAAVRARAQEPQLQFVDLKYDVDPAVSGCPSASEFRSIVAQQLGYDPHSPDAPLGVEIRVRASDGGLDGSIDWSNLDANKLGERRFNSRNQDCREMMTTVGFVLAVQIQLMATERAKSVAPRTNPETHVPAPLETRSSVSLALTHFDVRPAVVRPYKWEVSAGLGPSLGFNLAPNTSAQGRFFVGIGTRGFGLEAGGEASLPSTRREAYGGGFRHDLLLGTVATCAWLDALGVCGMAKLGRIHVEGTGVDKPLSPSGFVALTGLRLAYQVELGDHLALLGHLDGLYSLSPWTVDLNRLDVWTMPRFSEAVGIDLAVRFHLQ